jgi:hypothetical protein
MAPRIQIFRAGRHVAADGSAVEFTQADVDGAIAAYDPKLHEAPIVIGHPRDNAPAFGWIGGLGAKPGGLIEASVSQLDPAFAEEVRAGKWKKVSASFYRPDSPANPKPGSWYLRHVGFLGAQPPAVKGLAPVSFAGGDADFVELDLAELDVSTLLRSLRDWILAKFGTEDADKALPAWYVDEAQRDAAVEASKGGVDYAEPKASAIQSLRTWIESQFGAEAAEAALPAALLEGDEEDPKAADAAKATADASTPAADKAAADMAEAGKRLAAHLAKRPAKRSPRELELERREAALVARERAARKAEHVAFCEGLVREGRPLPVTQAEAVGLLEALDYVRPNTVSFGEGDRRSPGVVMRELLARLPKQVEFAELGGGALGDDADPAAIAQEAQSFQAKRRAEGVHVSTSDAVRAVKGAR